MVEVGISGVVLEGNWVEMKEDDWVGMDESNYVKISEQYGRWQSQANFKDIHVWSGTYFHCPETFKT